ncbi:UNVERIFIED_CONTAM: RNA polymerase sigma factor sigE, chloroplastic/mitochondrial [Sesamum radiatum]|uniref:RNA polymerase sigma factor sigE, chloroplastic/mitochondrial n=1 Tax=Sesamum radiatum TaxID=300843 RepID=A0AAW2JZX0_SESRA
MGVVAVSSSAAQTPVRLKARCLTRVSSLKMRVKILSFKDDRSKNTSLVGPRESPALTLEATKENGKSVRKVKKRVSAVSKNEASPSTLELDYSEAAAKLEKIYKRSPATFVSDEEVDSQRLKRVGEGEETEKKTVENVVRSRSKMGKRLSLEKRIALKMKEQGYLALSRKKKQKQEL